MEFSLFGTLYEGYGSRFGQCAVIVVKLGALGFNLKGIEILYLIGVGMPV